MKNILVSGLFNIETTLKIKGFPLEYFPIDYPFFGINSSVSGVAMNIAKAEKVLGNEVNIVSILGDDYEGGKIISEVQSLGIGSQYMLKDLKETPTSIILYDSEGKRQIYCDLKDIQDKMYNPIKAEEALNKCDIAVMCNINFNRELLKAAKSKNKIIATDVHVLNDIEDKYNKDFMENSNILFLSDENIVGDHKEFLFKLKERYNMEIIVLGEGNKGALIYIRDEDKFYKMDSVKVGEVVNTVGAGDSLFSAFINYYAKGFSPLECLGRAQAFASYKIGFNGAANGFLTEEKLEEIYKKISIKYQSI